MTQIVYTRNGIIIDGHTKDPVVCHGLSAISQKVANYVIDNHLGSASSSDGRLKIDVSEQYFGCDLFRAMRVAFKDIAQEYPNNVKIIYT